MREADEQLSRPSRLGRQKMDIGRQRRGEARERCTVRRRPRLRGLTRSAGKSEERTEERYVLRSRAPCSGGDRSGVEAKAVRPSNDEPTALPTQARLIERFIYTAIVVIEKAAMNHELRSRTAGRGARRTFLIMFYDLCSRTSKEPLEVLVPPCVRSVTAHSVVAFGPFASVTKICSTAS